MAAHKGSPSDFIAPASVLLLHPTIYTVKPLPGIDLHLINGHVGEHHLMQTTNDTGKIHFNAWLSGQAMFRFDRDDEENISQLHGSVCYMPEAALNVSMKGEVSDVMAMVSPATLQELMGDEYEAVGRDIERGVLQRPAQRGKSLQTAASRLRNVLLGPADAPYNKLALAAACMDFLLHCMPGVDTATGIGTEDRVRLRRGRDFLIQDLASPPLLVAVAQAAGMSVSRLKRLFPQMFGRSVYAYYQGERMAAAKHLLQQGHDVTHAALTVGYSNFSHFSLAFRNQFGVNPSIFKR